MGAWEDGFAAGWRAGQREVRETGLSTVAPSRSGIRSVQRTRSSSKRKASAYSKRYGAAFKRLAKKNKKKGGGWKAGGFARTQKAAHKAAKR